MFAKGHSASSARHAYESEQKISCAENNEETQRVLADRAVNPNVQDYSRLYDQWRKDEMGDENGPGMFTKLEEEIGLYNECNSFQNGKVLLQRYEACLPESDDASSDCSSDDLDTRPLSEQPPKKK
eukprot:m.208174 g.208174  ORF g.208174 m.208174 type:complete len:126 (+) comp39701_c1_seq9:1064-1441(+)